MKINIYYLIFLIYLLSFSFCSTPQQRAEKNAFDGACPKYGFFSEKEINELYGKRIGNTKSEFYFLNDDENRIEKSYVAIKAHDGRIIHHPATSFYNARSIANKEGFEKFRKDFIEICGSKATPIAKTKYELVEAITREVEELKESTKWKKALESSAEFDLGEKGTIFKLAHFNEKDNDLLNFVGYLTDPAQENQDRKIWTAIKKKKNVYIQKDNSAKNSFFFSEDYDLNKKIYPIYFEQGTTFGRSGMIPGDGMYVPRLKSDLIQLKISPEIATKIGNGTKYNLEVIFSSSIEVSNYHYYAVNDNGLVIILNEEKAEQIRKADPFTFRSLSKVSGKGKTIKLKPIYYIFSIPEEEIVITNLK
ncbi:MAG: hypothetical protein JJT78_03970 [Leptospira sp.]|nr:hypothetical protein [Leptospira sp.]